VQTITIEPAPAATFLSVPNDTTLTCSEAGVFIVSDLNYTNNLNGTCEISGSVPGMIDGEYDLCGGTQTVTGEFTDSCGNTISHVQTLSIEPAAEPFFVDPPDNVSLTCGEFDPVVPDLAVSNGLTGICGIDTIVSGTQQGSGGPCGSELTRTWEFTDACGRTIIHQQLITTSASAPPVFVNPPVDSVLSCEEIILYSPDSLLYSNSESGSCALSGMVAPIMSGSHTICGGTYTISWTYSDSCGTTLEHVQIITIEPVAEATFNVLPSDITVSCNTADTIVFQDLTYDNNNSGLCQITGAVPAVVDINYNSCGGNITATWMFTDSCGRTIEYVQSVSVEPATEPAFISPPADLTLSCNALDTFTFVSLDYTKGGSGT
jgi:hypothetical protein